MGVPGSLLKGLELSLLVLLLAMLESRSAWVVMVGNLLVAN